MARAHAGGYIQPEALIHVAHYSISHNIFHFNWFLAPHPTTLSPHSSNVTCPDSLKRWTQTINSWIYNVICLHIPCENKDPGKSMFSFSIYLHHYHECHANTLDLPNDDGLKQSSYISPISSSAQLHIPYHKNKKCMKAKINFFTFHLSVVPQTSIMRIRTLPVSSIIFIFICSLSLS